MTLHEELRIELGSALSSVSYYAEHYAEHEEDPLRLEALRSIEAALKNFIAGLDPK